MTTILVVDDEETIASTVKSCLEVKGYAVSVSLTSQEARDAIDRARPDLVVLDIKLKEADGVEVLKWIRRHHSNLPVVVMTGYETEELRQQISRLGALRTIHKPVSMPELQRQIAEIAATLPSTSSCG